MGPTDLVHSDRFGWTGVDADTAIDAVIVVDDCFFLSHTNSLAWALSYTGFAAGTFFFIYVSWHLYNPFKKTPKFQ